MVSYRLAIYKRVQVTSVHGAALSGTVDRSLPNLETWLWSWLRQKRQFENNYIFNIKIIRWYLRIFLKFCKFVLCVTFLDAALCLV